MATGRKLYSRYSKILKCSAKAIGLLPRSVRNSLLRLFQNTGGKTGIAIRYILVKTLAKSCGNNVSIKQYVFLENIRNISFGDNVSVHPFCYLEGSGGIDIGNDVSLAHNTSILSVNHTWEKYEIPIKYNLIEHMPVKICDDVWVGCGCRLMAGITINSRSIIAAGAVVTRDVESNTIVGGVPAKKSKIFNFIMSKNVNNNNPTLTYRLLHKMKLLNDVQKHGNITFFGFIRFTIDTIVKRALFTYAYKGYFLEPLNKKFIRPAIWRFCGCELGKNVHIGHMVRMDFGNPKRIHLADDVILSNGVTILCHKRDVSQYYRGESALKLPFLYEDVYIERGCQLGLNVTVMPGVHIGEGSIIGTGAVVTKDIPAWSVAVGFPAKVIRQIELIDDNWLIVSELNNGGGKIDM